MQQVPEFLLLCLVQACPFFLFDQFLDSCAVGLFADPVQGIPEGLARVLQPRRFPGQQFLQLVRLGLSMEALDQRGMAQSRLLFPDRDHACKQRDARNRGFLQQFQGCDLLCQGGFVQQGRDRKPDRRGPAQGIGQPELFRGGDAATVRLVQQGCADPFFQLLEHQPLEHPVREPFQQRPGLLREPGLACR